MTPADILEQLNSCGSVTASTENGGVLNAIIAPDRLKDTVHFVRDILAMDMLNFVTAIDWIASNELELVYNLLSTRTQDKLVLKVRVPRENGSVATVSDLYRTAEWHERETSELFGIHFDGHPDPRPLLLPEEFKGFPLKKDFTHPNFIRLPEVK
jgi:NADH:ubiquinone oxidoreductase subunit C